MFYSVWRLASYWINVVHLFHSYFNRFKLILGLWTVDSTSCHIALSKLLKTLSSTTWTFCHNSWVGVAKIIIARRMKDSLIVGIVDTVIKRWKVNYIFLNGPNPVLFLFIFVLFTFQFKWQIYNLNNINWKSDGVLGPQSRGGRMEGADESTKLWRHPEGKF